MPSLRHRLARLGASAQAAVGAAAPGHPSRTAPLADHRDAHDRAPSAAAAAPLLRPHLWWFIERMETTAKHGMVALYELLHIEPHTLAALGRDRRLEHVDPRRLLFVDTETTGLGGGVGVIAFLVGIAFFRGNQLFVEQLQLGGFGHEKRMLERLRSHLERAEALVTYNGKCFDLPLLRARFVLHGMALPARIHALPHIDLLHAARRLVHRTSDHRLTTLERVLCRFERHDDVPSAFIPLRFAAFARGELDSLDDVVLHNRDDVVAMVAFVVALSARLEGRRHANLAASELLAVAQVKYLAHRRHEALALAHEALAAGEGAEAIAAALWAARLHGKEGAWQQAAHLLERALLAAPDSAAPAHLALAKIFEHRLIDVPRALRHAQRAVTAEDASRSARRLARLRCKMAGVPWRIRPPKALYPGRNKGRAGPSLVSPRPSL